MPYIRSEGLHAARRHGDERCIDVESQTIIGRTCTRYLVKEKLGLVPEVGQGGATWLARDEIWGNQNRLLEHSIEIPSWSSFSLRDSPSPDLLAIDCSHPTSTGPTPQVKPEIAVPHGSAIFPKIPVYEGGR